MPVKPRLTRRKLLASLVLPPVAVIALVVVLISGSTPAATTSQDDVAAPQRSLPDVTLLARTNEPTPADAVLAADNVATVDEAPPEEAALEEAISEGEMHIEEVLDPESVPEAAAVIEEAPAPPPPPPPAPPLPEQRQVQPTPRPAPTATPVPPPPPPPPAAPASLGSYEADLLAAHNAERARAGLPALQSDATLTAAARRRAQDMAARGYFAHTSPSGESISTILNINSYALLGENIARNTYPANQTVSVAMSGFMQSASHRANILSREFTRAGIGTSVSGNQRYFSVIYGAPR